MKLLSVFLSMLFIVSCSVVNVDDTGRGPASVNEEFVYSGSKDVFRAPASTIKNKRAPASIYDFLDGTLLFYKDIDDQDEFNVRNCDVYLDNIADYVLNRGTKKFIPRTANEIATLSDMGLDIVKQLMQIRIRLKERHSEFAASGKLTEACTASVRRSIRYARYMEEFVIEWLYSRKGRAEEIKKNDFSKTPLQFFLNPKFKEFKFQSGDVLVVRAQSFVSATIARIGDQDGQFSHGALIYIDKKGLKGKKGEIYVLEELIEEGGLIVPLQEWVKQGHTRDMVFRHKDRKLAEVAAEKAFNYLNGKKKILYDFRMEMNGRKDYDTMFCTEVIRYGYDLATDGKYMLPTFGTSVTKFQGKSKFLKDMNMNVDWLFAPSDMELEPDFDLVLEWRNPKTTANRRVQDAILSKMMTWMEDDGYQLTYVGGSPLLYGKSKIANLLRHFGIKVPSNMSRGFLNTFLLLENVTKVFEDHIFKIQEEYFKKHGYSLNYKDILDELEKFRRDDCKQFRQYRSEIGDYEYNDYTIKFHSHFNARGKCLYK